MSDEIEIEKLAPIAKEQRNLTELFKKGLNSAESITVAEYEARQLAVINELETLCGLRKSHFTKDDKGTWILTQGE